MYLIQSSGYTWCRDGRWRESPDFGSFSDCAKTYRTHGGAIGLARRMIATNRHLGDEVTVLSIEAAKQKWDLLSKAETGAKTCTPKPNNDLFPQHQFFEAPA